MSNSSFVLPLGDPRCREVRLSGGKGGSLATMVQQGLPVPPGFVITSAAFLAEVDEGRLRSFCSSGNMADAREIVAAARPPTALIADQYALISGPVAVRSSACAEELSGGELRRSAGKLSQRRWTSRLILKIVECWLSFFADRAVFYRAEKGSLDDSPWQSSSKR